jgi:1-deoxy-D-xylulose-5-phosphate synthase
MPLLDTITTPADLRALDAARLPEVCAEIRQLLISHLAQTGGHFASNLGTVELAVALHFVFDTPRDEIVWDTGHQAYPHKILTGRRARFDSLRQYHGLSGYPTPEESPYDTFPVGHAGTSISVALGLAKARDMRGGAQHVVAIIGDGGLTSGLALEGLNNAHGCKRLLVILNDNKMSISPTIGALARHFSMLVASPQYRYLKHQLGRALEGIPLIGRALARLVIRLQGGIKHIIAPQNVFENLGFHYLGPIDGHNIGELVSILRSCKAEPEMPVLLHVITQKGKGYDFAERDPERYHGVTPFDACSGEMNHRDARPTYTDLMSDLLHEVAARDARIVIVSAAMCGGIGMTRFAREFPSRFVDVGIAEQHAVTFAGGLAARGFRPVVGIYSTFLQRAYDEIAHDVCMPCAPVLFIIDRAGLVGSDGKTHHGVFDIAYLRHLPNMRIFMPRDETAMRLALQFALQAQQPCALRYARCSVPTTLVEGGLPPFAAPCITQWESLMPGDAGVVLAIGHMVFYAARAAQLLRARGLALEVVDACALWPLDTATLDALLARHTRLITLEDHVVTGGFGAAVAEYVAQCAPHARVTRIGIPDRFVEHGGLPELYAELGWQPEQLAARFATACRTA